VTISRRVIFGQRSPLKKLQLPLASHAIYYRFIGSA
jgi:hypothetical protein